MKGYLRPGGLAETARQLGREALAEVAGFLHHCGRGAWLLVGLEMEIDGDGNKKDAMKIES